jgi:hypothetical protein
MHLLWRTQQEVHSTGSVVADPTLEDEVPLHEIDRRVDEEREVR